MESEDASLYRTYEELKLRQNVDHVLLTHHVCIVPMRN